MASEESSPDVLASSDPKALIVALELLRQAVTSSTVMFAATVAKFSIPAPTSPAATSGGESSGLTPSAPTAGGAPVPAFDRPQPVIIMGPKPLPVTIVGGLGRALENRESKEDAKGVFAGLGSLLSMQFAAVLGPLALFGSIISSQASGLQILGTAVKLLAAVLAPIFLPIILSVAAALVELSDEISTNMGPAIKNWTRLIFSTVLPALVFLAKIAGVVIGAFSAVANAIMRVVNPIANAFGQIIAALQRVVEWIESKIPRGLRAATATEASGKKVSELLESDTFIEKFRARMRAEGKSIEAITEGWKPADIARLRERLAGAVARPVPAAGAGGGGRPEAIDDVLTAFRTSIMPKASVGNLAGIHSQVQTAALNTDPIEARMLTALIRAADGIDGVRADMRAERGAGPVFPVGGP